MNFIKSSIEHAEIELNILNSDHVFNQISKDKEQFELAEIEEKISNSADIGAVRFLIQDSDRFIGVLEFLMNNPGDGRTWLGLLQINKSYIDIHGSTIV